MTSRGGVGVGVGVGVGGGVCVCVLLNVGDDLGGGDAGWGGVVGDASRGVRLVCGG